MQLVSPRSFSLGFSNTYPLDSGLYDGLRYPTFEQRLDKSIQWIAQVVFTVLIHWIVIHPVNSASQLLSNWDLSHTCILVAF